MGTRLSAQIVKNLLQLIKFFNTTLQYTDVRKGWVLTFGSIICFSETISSFDAYYCFEAVVICLVDVWCNIPIPNCFQSVLKLTLPQLICNQSR
jgi:hypothetical protein